MEVQKDLPLASNKTNYHKTQDLTVFDKSAYIHEEEGINYIENREEILELQEISLTTLDDENLIFFSILEL